MSFTSGTGTMGISEIIKTLISVPKCSLSASLFEFPKSYSLLS